MYDEPFVTQLPLLLWLPFARCFFSLLFFRNRKWTNFKIVKNKFPESSWCLLAKYSLRVHGTYLNMIKYFANVVRLYVSGHSVDTAGRQTN